MSKTNTYNVKIRTGDHNLAGTDSNVYIQLTGTDGQTGQIHLPARDLFSFEAGSVDTYVLEIPDLGNLTECCIGHDNEEGDSGWYIADVIIADDDTNREWVFKFEQWLGVEESGKLYECVQPS